VIGSGKNWSLPAFWAPCLRYITSPILAIVLSLAYPSFETVNNDPLHVLGFIIGHFLFVWCVVGFFMPRWLDAFIIPERRDDWKQPTAPGLLRDTTDGQIADNMEAGSGSPSDSLQQEKTKTKHSTTGNNGFFDSNTQRDSSSSLTVDPQSDNTPKQI
jgi:solute carrier family 6 (neurotransmitter transporter, GABA) member 1